MRNLTKALTVVSLLAPVSGHTLGIGDIRVRSALNQNLNAEIALVAAKGENPANIKVNLAPADKFDEAGIPWTYFLSKIKFAKVVKPNGSVVIKVTSREAVKEPYLNFLLEVSWPKGNLYREFTVLVDPPSDYKQNTYQEPAYSYQEPAYNVSSRYDDYAPRKQDYAPRQRAVRHANRTRRNANATARNSNGAGSYGGTIVTRRNDTLWKVASRARGSGVSVEQMMMALYDNNPNAFYQQNVNALSAGKVLKVPEKSAAQQTSRQEALNDFARHNEAWNNNRSGIARSESQVAKEEAVESQLKLEAPNEATVAANETVAPSSKQTSGSRSESAATAASAKQTDAAATKETASAPVDDALQSKVAALEKQMAMMQQLIALKDKQLAELQNPSQTAPVPAENVQQPVPEPPAVKSPEPTAAQPVNPPQPPLVKAEPPPPVQPVQPSKPAPKPIVKKVIPPPQPVEEPDSPLPWILGGLGAILLPLFGWLWWQKKKIIQETEAESMFRNYTTMRSGESSGPLTTIARKKASGLGGAESSFLNDFKASDFETFESFNVDHADIDPIEEADVYLAYGRYQQAEDLIRQAIKTDPERDECKLKLLEIFHASANKEDFENYAIELAAAGKQEDKDFWRKAAELSKDICPDSPLFANPAPSSVAVFQTESEVLTETVLLGSAAEQNAAVRTIEEPESFGAANFEIPEEASESSFDIGNQETALEEISAQSDLTKETSVSGLSEITLESFKDRNNMEADNEALDFDLDFSPPGKPEKTEIGTAEVPSPDTPVGIEPADRLDDLDEKNDFETFEFDFNLDKTKADSPEKTETKPIDTIDAWDSEQTIDFSFGVEPAAKSADEEMVDLNFDLDQPIDSPAKLSYQEHDFAVSDLTDMDEIETKLDLAKAYIDMGDVDSAKEIIEQVLQKGSSEQKQAATALLDDIGLS